MKLVIGLGNPGDKYLTTRHNAGFLLIDLLAMECSIRMEKNKFGGLYGMGQIGNEKVIFVKPQGFMNRSGTCVQQFAHFYQLTADEIIVFHDDLDLLPGHVKMRKGGGHGGHNGIRHMIECLGSGDFTRIKIGIGKPEDSAQVTNWVLSPFFDAELDALRTTVFDECMIRIEQIIK